MSPPDAKATIAPSGERLGWASIGRPSAVDCAATGDTASRQAAAVDRAEAQKRRFTRILPRETAEWISSASTAAIRSVEEKTALVEMQPAIAAAEIEQRIEAGVEARLDHFADQHVMVAAVVYGVTLAFEHAERFPEDRRARLSARPGSRSEAILVTRREADRRRLLPRLQHVHGEVGRGDQRFGARRLLVDAHQQQRRLQRHGRKAVDRQAGGRAIVFEAGDDGDAGGEAAERVAKRAGIVSAAIFAFGRLHHAVRYSLLDCHCEAR